MIQTIEAVVDEMGTVRLLEAVRLTSRCRALVTILNDEPAPLPSESALMSENSLSTDWDRPEEELAWAHLQRGM